MAKVTLSMLIIFLLIESSISFGQDIEVSDPRLELRENKLHITYDIINSELSEEFTVSMQITDANGQEIPAIALAGDIGDQVKGGNNKRIVWDLTADQIVMNARIFVKIYAKAISPPEADKEVLKKEEDQIKEIPDERMGQDDLEIAADAAAAEAQKNMETTSSDLPPSLESKNSIRAALIVQSLPLPGLGLSRHKGNPHWIKGVLAYGCLTGSIILNRRAINTYNQIPRYVDWDTKNDLFQTSQKQDGFSEGLAYAAVGIWVSDLIWTILGTSDLKTSPLNSETNDFSIRTSIDPLSSAPLIGIRFVF